MSQEELLELQQRGVACMINEKYEEAEEIFRRCSEEDPKLEKNYVHWGNALVNLERYEESLTCFKKALLLEKEKGEILYSIGNVYFLMGRNLEAVKQYNKAEAEGYRNADMYLIMSGIFMEKKDMVQALRFISKAIEQEPLRGELYSEKVALQLNGKDYEGAEETLMEYQELLPDSYDVYDLQTKLYCGQGNYEAAKAAAARGLERFPEDAAMHLLLIRVYIESEEFEAAKKKALSLLDMRLKGDLYRSLILYLATAQINLEETSQAVERMENYIKLLWDDEIAYLLLNCYETERQYDKIKTLAAAMKDTCKTEAFLAAARFYEADAIEKTEGLEKARPVYRQLIREFRKRTLEDNRLYELYIYRLMCHVRLAEYDKAIELGDYLENAQPELADGPMYKYYIYSQLGDSEKAEKEKEKALLRNPALSL